MKKQILKILSIVLAFILGLVFMSYYQAAGNTDSTEVMASASLPMVYLEQEGRMLNRMQGYTQAMEASYMRGTILPLPENRELNFQIESPNQKVEKLFYEVRSRNTERLIEDGEISDYSRENGQIHASVILKDLLDEGEEYLLVLRLELEKEKEVLYYTHLLNDADTHLAECLDFVDMIHNALFDKNNSVSIAQYLETDSSADNDTLSHVTIHSRYKQLIWGDMEVALSSPVQTFVTEAEASIASVRLEYEVSHENEAGEKERYEVCESYRVRYTGQRMYLLNYDRTAERIFDPNLSVFTGKTVELGILDGAVEYRKNTEENVVGFVQNQELWCYDTTQNKLSHVFGFREGTDLRGRFDQHEIRILDLDESGSMNFLVCGYMSRGLHEGRTGVAVYHYDSLTNSVEERLFIESTRPSSVLNADLGELAYVNQKGELYLHFQETIYKILLDTRSCEVVASDVKPENCLISEEGNLAAWHQGDSAYDAESIGILNLETGRNRRVQAREGCFLRVLGFMGTDFIYGEAVKEDIVKDISGSFVFPMGYVVIQDEQGNVIREFDYRSQGKYVVSIEIESNRISLSCVEKAADGTYVESTPEPITNKTVETTEQISLETRNSSAKKREYYFALTNAAADSRLKVLTPKQVLLEGSRTLALEKQDSSELYYAYAFNGKLTGVYRESEKVVAEAYTWMGSVVDSAQNDIWRRGNRKSRTELSGFENPQEKQGETSLQAALEMLLAYEKTYVDVGIYLEEGAVPYEILKTHSNGQVLKLTGCPLSAALYYVSQGYPVLALEGGTEAELLVGYDVQNVVLLNPLKGETYKKGMNDSTQFFEELGNLFIVCVPEPQ